MIYFSISMLQITLIVLPFFLQRNLPIGKFSICYAGRWAQVTCDIICEIRI